eukprot:PhF_6_TR40349/c0_g1_i6/m.60020
MYPLACVPHHVGEHPHRVPVGNPTDICSVVQWGTIIWTGCRLRACGTCVSVVTDTFLIRTVSPHARRRTGRFRCDGCRTDVGLTLPTHRVRPASSGPTSRSQGNVRVLGSCIGTCWLPPAQCFARACKGYHQSPFVRQGTRPHSSGTTAPSTPQARPRNLHDSTPPSPKPSSPRRIQRRSGCPS